MSKTNQPTKLSLKVVATTISVISVFVISMIVGLLVFVKQKLNRENEQTRQNLAAMKKIEKLGGMVTPKNGIPGEPIVQIIFSIIQ